MLASVERVKSVTVEEPLLQEAYVDFSSAVGYGSSEPEVASNAWDMCMEWC